MSSARPGRTRRAVAAWTACSWRRAASTRRAEALRAELADDDRATLGPATSTPEHPAAPSADHASAASTAAAGTAATATPAGSRQRAARAFEDAQRADPLFAPHAHSVFRREALLGAGGMGEVYRVEDTRLGRAAAMKVLLGGMNREGLVARFLREARITAQLDHPGIPPIFEAGTTTTGEPYIVMRVIEGETLAAAIDRYHADDRPVEDLRRIIEALARVTEALSRAHERRIIHRDLKPENIMLGEHGEVLVMDWGIARELGREDEAFLREDTGALAAPTGSPSRAASRHLTEAGVVLGTPGFMPPEQAGGDEIDARADVFALGAMLTEALTGEVPVEGATTINRLTALMKGHIRRPGEIDPTVPAPLDSLAAAALAFDPAERLPDAATFGAELRRWLRGDPLDCHPESLGERGARILQRHAGKLVSGLLLILLLVISGGLYAGLQQARQDTRTAEENARLRDRERERMATALKAFSLARSLTREHFGSELDSADLRRLHELLERAVEAADSTPEALRTAADIARGARARPEAQRWLEQLARSSSDALAEEGRIGLAFLALERGSRKDIWTAALGSVAGDGADHFAKVHEALELRREGRHVECRRRLDALVESAPRPAMEALIRSIRSEVRHDLIDVRGALEDARRVVQLAPDVGYFQAALAFACLQMGRNDRAAEVIEAARSKLPNDPRVRFMRVQVATMRGSSLHLLPELRELSANPVVTVKARRLLATLLVSTVEAEPAAQAQREEAMELLTAMRRSENAFDRALAPLQLRRLAIARGDAAAGPALIKESCAVTLPRPLDRYLRADMLISAKRYEEATADLEAVVKAVPGSAKATTRLAWCRFQQDRVNDALELLDRAGELDPEYALVDHYRGVIFSSRGQHERALEAQTAAVRKRREFKQAYYEQARALIGLNRPNEALKALDESLVIGLANPTAYLLRARLRLQLGLSRAALNDVKSARRLGYTNRSELSIVEALCYAKLNDPERAFEIYDRLLELNPGHVDALSNRGWLRMYHKRWEAAARDFRRFIELAPQHPQVEAARRFLRQCEQQLGAAKAPR